MCSFYQEHLKKKEAARAAAATSNPSSAKMEANDPRLRLARWKLATAVGRVDTAKQFVSGPTKAVFDALRKELGEADVLLYKVEGFESESEKEVEEEDGKDEEDGEDEEM